MDSPSTTLSIHPESSTIQSAPNYVMPDGTKYTNLEEMKVAYDKLYHYVLEHDPTAIEKLIPAPKSKPRVYTENGYHYTMTDVSVGDVEMWRLDPVDAEGNPLRK